MGDEGDEPYFKKTLNDVAQNNPGLVLLGESIDVDVDEPSVTVRWSIIGCGDAYTLANSTGIHGSSCGLPVVPLRIYVDSNADAKADYNPTQLPFVQNTGQRRNIQNLVQFDSDHVLDVHRARLYPFDTYLLTTTLRAINLANQTIPIQKITSIDQTSNFYIDVSDLDSYGTLADGTQSPSRDVDFRVSRPGQARAFALLLFAVSWMLTHVSIGYVILDWYTEVVKTSLVKHLVLTFAILLVHPQLRNSMPDAPGYDGVLIDCIGFFPQMILSATAVIILLVMLIAREFDLNDINTHNSYAPLPPAPTVYKGSRKKSTSSGTLTVGRTSSIHIGHNDLSRLIGHLNGEFVFPPPSTGSQVHRRNASSKAELNSVYWSKKFDKPRTDVLQGVDEEYPKSVIE